MLMTRTSLKPTRRPWLAFGLAFAVSLALGAAGGSLAPGAAAQGPQPTPEGGRYAGAEFCANCHEQTHAAWQSTRHAHAFSSPIFQQNWEELGGQFTCLACHTTGYDASSNSYAAEGVACEACHGPFIVGHPEIPMPFTPDASLCATCHQITTDEWRASKHGQAGINCQSCHNPHSQAPLADNVTGLCTNCHRDPGDSFTHGTHANAGLECSNCHMYTNPRTSPPISGLVATGHTFSVGSEACIGCHQDTVHTRDTILALSGEPADEAQADPEIMRQELQARDQEISDLKASGSVRLYIGLAQGAIVGLITGGAAAWVVSRRIKVVEIEVDDEQEEDQG
jgi:predicted CXXCH cytochrome family protein